MNFFKKTPKGTFLPICTVLATCSSLGILYLYSYTSSSPRHQDQTLLNNSAHNLSKIDNVQRFADLNHKEADFIAPACTSYDEFHKPVSNLKLNIHKSRQWHKNIIKTQMNSSDYIQAYNKKGFKAALFVNNSLCPLKASVRISGDYKDHLAFEYGTPVASMDIKLKDENVSGVTKFKLFLPNTRNGIYEVVTASLFSYLGFLAPRTFMVQVNVNGTTLPYIFQEKQAKELLEANNRRESSIYKFDESLIWKIRHKRGSFNSILSPVVVNSSWASRNATTSFIANLGLNKLSREFNKVHKGLLHINAILDERQLSGHSNTARQRQSFYIVLSLITNSNHGFLVNHNRRFYYNSYIDQLEPIYYDGNSRYNSISNPDQQKIPFRTTYSIQTLAAYKEFLDLDYAEGRLREIDVDELRSILLQRGVNLDRQSIISLKKELLSNLTLLKDRMKDVHLNRAENTKSSEDAVTDSDRKLVDSLNIGSVSLLNGNKVHACHPSLQECTTFLATQKQLKDIYRGSFAKDSLSYKYTAPESNLAKHNVGATSSHGTPDFRQISLPDFQLRIYGDPLIQLNAKSKVLNFILKDRGDKIVIHDGHVNGWKITGSSKTAISLEVPDARHDAHLLTSSLTIQDSSLSDLEVIFNGGLLEDSLNLVRVKGHISKLQISNSFQDALDADFSDLVIDAVSVDNAGNDCIDFSSGKYSVRNAILTGCADKGLSIGERSEAKFTSVKIQDASVAFVSKDSSVLIVDDAVVTDSVLCAAAYRKKQEFVGAKLQIPSYACDSKDLFIQENSEILLK